MAGFKKGSMPYYQMSIGMFTNIAKKIHEKAPQCDDNVKGLVRLYADYVVEDVPDIETGEELVEAMMKKILEN